MVITQVAATVLIADLVSGIAHWWEDTYARPDHQWFGWIAKDNDLHHHRPREFLGKNWLQSSWDLLLASAIVLAGAWALDLLTWHVWLFAALTANANQFHKWTHSAERERGKFVTFLQRLRILQTPRHHSKHHQGEKNSYYCVVTNFLNPILEELNFWRGIERFFSKVFGWKSRHASVKERA
jgi:plasmanylethanolamine desaturase